MAYPARPVLEVLPEFRESAVTRPTSEQRLALIEFCRHAYEHDRRSIREVAELTGRSQTAVRRALRQGGVDLRPRGAQPLSTQPPRLQ